MASATSVRNCKQLRPAGCELTCETDSTETGMAFLNLRKNKASLTAQFEAGTLVLRY